MSETVTMLIVVAVMLFVALIVAVIIPFLKRKGVDIDAIIVKIGDMTNLANTAMVALRELLPEGAVTDVFEKILRAAEVAVWNAEQLNKIGKLEADQRKEEARQYIKDAITQIGITITPAIERLIDGAIESQVLKLKANLQAPK